MKIRELCRLIFFCGLAVVFGAVDTCGVSYVLLCCKSNVFSDVRNVLECVILCWMVL